MDAKTKEFVREAASLIQNKVRETGTLLADRMDAKTEAGNQLKDVISEIESVCDKLKEKFGE